jgi:hypothetical protein
VSDALERAADVWANDDGVGALYAARARELAIEARMTACVGDSAFWPLARVRFARTSYDGGADSIASTWLGESACEEGERILSDDAARPDSLVSRMRQAIGEARLPWSVVVSDRMSALAATGRTQIFVAAGKALTRETTERTVLHEIQGHAGPRARAAHERRAIFMAGTANGSEHQEGRALLLERRHGYLQGARRRELALRHIAARTVEERVGFVDTVTLLETHGAALADALRIAVRVWRAGGLAREITYLRSMLAVDAALAETPAIEELMTRGRVGVAAAVVLLRDEDIASAPGQEARHDDA